MATTDPTVADDIVTVTLDADEANAVVYAVAFAVTAEAEGMEFMPLSASPGDLGRISTRCRRIASLADVNDQLRWRAHWGPHGGEPPAISVAENVLLDVVRVLQDRAAERRGDPKVDEYDGPFEFDRAARTIARSFADATAEVA